MANNSQRPLVNQRLYFCRLHLQWLEQQLQQQSLPQSVLQQSLGESIIFHLVLAYRAYLAEIAVAYGTVALEVETAQQLVEELSAAGYQSAEAQELVQLESDSQGFGRLFVQFRELGPVQAEPKPTVGTQLIAVQTPGPNDEISLDVAQGYFDQLNELIANQRSRLEEW